MPQLHLTTAELVYLFSWCGICVLSLVFAIPRLYENRRHVQSYLQQITVPWKLVCFVPALLFLCSAGSYTDDPTWDSTSGGGMAVLTYMTAPWATGVWARYWVGLPSSLRARWFALVLLLFSSSWFYDGYLLLRDGTYPVRWWSNLMISPFIYILGGLFWNLESSDPKRAWNEAQQIFSFFDTSWPLKPPKARQSPPLRALIVIMAAAVLLLTAFVRWHF